MSRDFFHSLAREAAGAYPAHERFARHFAFGKLKGDPAFAHMLRERLVPENARVLDIGCGQGLLCSLLLAAHARHARGDWSPGWPEPPAVSRYTGIELMQADVERARSMAVHWQGRRQGWPTHNFIAGDMRDTEFPHVDVAVILDVLHYIAHDAQVEVLERVRAALAPKGLLLIRVGDEAPTLRFRYTLFIDRVVMAARGHRLPRLWCRPVSAWREVLARLGFQVDAVPMSAGTPFANVLLVARYDGPTP